MVLFLAVCRPYQETLASAQSDLPSNFPRRLSFPNEFSKMEEDPASLLLKSGNGFRCFAVDRSGVVAPISCPKKPRIPVKA